MKRILSFFSRWQEFILWLPVLIFLALLGWVLLGALDRTIGGDLLAQLLQLPISAAYLATACAAAWLFKRTYLFDLPEDEERQLHDAARAGDRSAWRMLLLDRAEWMGLVGLFVAFFWIAR
ncbi:hypothetical protein HH110_08905 [Stenotrophomonas sp. SAM-B]|uniref:hypothetical protein n=1 Tax=Stenotrophomonas sp. SAM-B TaxID=2729141 RepID=UPI0015A1071E|nr:hypothetical protein [Stenotrophomonas sp. SAM-B]NWF33164.1 hypothetical protein [Stenotrophomonas sp. SAM-B]